ncbi:GDSL-type esterase/lipase family protein [Wenyingzhuangia sp. 2_MG-2023]|uniref:SGNH/GDSL hydrolase family protein n=1 Tax=Wenyingzhuangia sp. 2_MG-2023 TaxID=3062639 RepID=UPI0026E2D4DC|nr:GDSL-type esterase/lipase family protein [Wenyingzhuangia sp. 2_MG-2023]MDO6738206.1 GDSL-type esterase/lipase family protein [Wenyingzhuangia sp. 2_MG-2023]
MINKRKWIGIIFFIFLLSCTENQKNGLTEDNYDDADNQTESVISKSNIQVFNAGVSGNTSDDLINRIEEDVINLSPDIVIVMVGTNDMVNSKKLVPYSTYKNNITKIVKDLKQESIDVILMSPPPVDSEFLYTRHSEEVFLNNPPNQKLDSVRNILKETSLQFNVGFVDVFSEFEKRGLPKHNQDEFIRNLYNSGSEDGVHLTPKGYILLSSLLFEYLLNNNYLDKKNLKIICFGDSITKGVHVEGSGTSLGETYSAVLLDFIKKFKDKN